MMKLKLIILFIIISNTTLLKAQVTYAKPEDFKLIKDRTLIIELLELDQKQIDTWEKKKEKAKTTEKAKKYSDNIQEYKSFVKDYNTFIRNAIEKNWDFNKTIEYKTNSEIAELRKKSKDYTILWFSESALSKVNSLYKYFPNLTIPTLNYSRIEKGTIKVDYSFFMIYTGNRKTNFIRETDISISLKLMRNHILEIEKTGKKKYSFREYAKDQAIINCNQLNEIKLAINETDIHKKETFSEINSAFNKGKIIKLTDDEISKAIETEDNIAVGFSIPITIVSASSGPLAVAKILFYKVFINTSSGKIYTYYGTGSGEQKDTYFRVKEFKDYGENCK